MNTKDLMPIIDALLAVAGKLRRFDGEFESTDGLEAELLDQVRRLMHLALFASAEASERALEHAVPAYSPRAKGAMEVLRMRLDRLAGVRSLAESGALRRALREERTALRRASKPRLVRRDNTWRPAP